MNHSNTITQGLIDIEAPPMPADGNSLVLSIVAVSIVAVILVFLFQNQRKSLRYQTRRKLRNQQRLYFQNPSDSHVVAFQIADTLRTGLGITRLAVTTRLPASLAAEQNRWNSFIETLDCARYTLKTCTNSEIDTLFSDAIFWIKKWR